MDPAKWRKTFPFTDAEILAVLEEQLAIASDVIHKHGGDAVKSIDMSKRRDIIRHFKQTGHISGAMIRNMLPFLVKKCALCGDAAHYYYGWSGRCQRHRLVRSTHWLQKLKRFRSTEASIAERRKSERQLAINDGGAVKMRNFREGKWRVAYEQKIADTALGDGHD